jgi:hypothetical protein
MRTLFFLTIIIMGCAFELHAEDDHWANEKPLISPAKSFSIFQKRDGDVFTTVHFQHKDAPDIRFTEVYPWPALFYISPDDHWMLQIQKSGSGDNISFLLRIDAEGRIWRMEPTLMEIAWDFIKRSKSLHEADLYHTGIDFCSWDLQAQQLHIKFSGTYMNRDARFVLPLIYDLKKNVIKKDPKT